MSVYSDYALAGLLRYSGNVAYQVSSEDTTEHFYVSALWHNNIDMAEDSYASIAISAGKLLVSDKSIATSPRSATAINSSSTSQLCADLPRHPPSKIGSKPRDHRRRLPSVGPLFSLVIVHLSGQVV